MVFVYGAYVIIGLISPIVMNKLSAKSVLTASLISPSIFYIITNFGVWAIGSTYTMDLQGLISCYVAGIPFFDESLLSTIIFAFTIYITMKLIIKNPSELILVKK